MPTLDDKELDATQPANSEEKNESHAKKRLVLIASGIAAAVFLTVLIFGFATNWKFGNNGPDLAVPPAPIPTEAPGPGGVTYEDYEDAEPGSGVLGDEVTINRSSAGWSLDVGVLNTSTEPSDFTVTLLDEAGKELSSKDVQLQGSFVEAVQVYLPQDYEGGAVTVRLDSTLLGEGLDEAEVTVGG